MNTLNLWLSSSLKQEIINDIECWHPLETGGVLMGYSGLNGDTVVTHIIASGNNAIHKKLSFKPDQEFQLEQISNIYNSSNGSISYLGDWHSHPKSSPNLSFLDKRTLTKIALTPESKCSNPIMVIFGEKPKRWTINAVKFVSGKTKIWPFTYCKYQFLNLKID